MDEGGGIAMLNMDVPATDEDCVHAYYGHIITLFAV